MKTVFSIFIDDLRSIATRPFVLVVAFGIALLPSLYAWVNIYANSDPYVNTSGIKIAVASRDKGYEQDGEYVNKASNIMDSLRDNHKIGWQFPGDAEKAIEGVKAGEYYGAIVFEEDFTSSMYHLEETLAAEEAPITFYSNAKKNGVASKITASAANNVLEQINTEYLRTVFGMLFQDTGDLAGKLEDSKAVDKMLNQLSDTRDALGDFSLAISQFTDASGTLGRSLEDAKTDLRSARSQGKSDVAKAKKRYEETKSALHTIDQEIDKENIRLKAAIDDLKKALDSIEGATAPERQKLAAEAAEKNGKILTILQDLRKLIPENAKTIGAQRAGDSLDQMIASSEKIQKELTQSPVQEENLTNAAEEIAVLTALYKDHLKPGLAQMVSDIQTAVKNLQPLLTSASGMLDDIYPVIDAAGDTVSSLDGSLIQLQAVLTALESKLNDVIREVKAADQDERKQKLIDLLGGDPDRYGEFFADLVGAETEEIYAVETYGTAMTPFYTVIALWVGGVMLISVLKTEVRRRKFPDATEKQCFFGRLLVFLLIGQVQAAVIIAGDIFLLHCHPVHPWLMWLAAAVISLTFVTGIYALASSLGDIGKAIVFVVLFIQIAGSGGTYPIEVLPEIFSKFFRFLPFPYAVNAVRETVMGMYENDLWIYLVEVLLFFGVALLFGMYMKRPFAGVREFLEEKQKETGVM